VKETVLEDALGCKRSLFALKNESHIVKSFMLTNKWAVSSHEQVDAR